MKAEDLMLGDYVYDLYGDKAVVRKLDDYNEHAKASGALIELLEGAEEGETRCLYGQIEPITLTEDLLKNNYSIFRPVDWETGVYKLADRPDVHVSVGKVVTSRSGLVVKINDARLVDPWIEAGRRFEERCDAFQNKLYSMGVKANRCNDGWVDRRNCKATFFSHEHSPGFYMYNRCLKVGDKIFIGDEYRGGRFATVTKVVHSTLWIDGDTYMDVWYSPADEILDGWDVNWRNEKKIYPFITRNNYKQRLSWLERLFFDYTKLVTDIYNESR